MIKGFAIYDKNTGSILATAPLSTPIGATLDLYLAAGYDAGWTWTYLEDSGDAGECDTCGIAYDPGSQLDHCGKCGNCWNHCQEKVSA